MNYSQESLERIEKVKNLKKAGISPYANKFDKKNSLDELKNLSEEKFSDVNFLMENGAENKFSTAGRMMTFRAHGKLSFAKIKDFSGELQIAFVRDKVKIRNKNELLDAIKVGEIEYTAYKFIEKIIDLGDFVGVKGEMFVTKHGEPTLFVNEIQILSKAIRPLPEKFHGIQDQDAIYRQRYLDFTMNDKSYQNAVLRTKIVKAIRQFYWKNDFSEVETPVLGNSASGAAAQPFITHHNDFDQDFYLRIAPETALKMTTAGRFERVFEIGKNFRNEGSSPTHMQEFTAVEHYAAWWNFEDNMKFTEEMFDFIFTELGISRKIMVKDKNGEAKEVDFGKKFEKIDYIEGVKKESGIDISEFGAEDEDELRDLIKSKGIQFEGMDKMGTTTLIDYLYKKVLRPKILGPAFVYNYPKTMQPLARQNDENPGIVEQFQLVVNGNEILKAYSELVDPFIQAENFNVQGDALERGDEEATAGDDEFLLAMEHGMPCQSGWGMGIDRFVSILTEQDNLRDTVLFPLMKPVSGEEKVEEVGE
ncbi:lysine--tRNA ligase [Candidatus Gracilibacteria bacterium]|nr:lysine--tRNA ligase [Candidatus Gracilibacteria bacterium]